MMRRTLGAALATAIGIGSPACKTTASGSASPDLPPPDRELVIPTEGFLMEFDNGLKLFVVPDPYTRLVQFDVRHQAGSRDDPPGKEGMAHFVEHLMFQMPVDGEGSPKLMSHVPQHSLFFNAYTATDQTHYIHTGTADDLEDYMRYTQLRLGYDCAAVPEAEFLRERDVVRNEHRLRGQGIDLYVYNAVNEVLFPVGHPYRRSGFASDEATASITEADACTWIKRWYTPGQASVVVAGDVEPDEVLALAKKYLEPLPRVDVPPRTKAPPIQLDQRQAKIEAPVKKPTAVILFEMPPRFSPDYMAVSAAAETMFISLAFFVNREGRIVKNWYGAGFGGEDAQVFGVAVETEKARELDRAVEEVVSAINRGFSASIEGKEYEGSYDSARQRARLNVLASVASVTGRGDAYADYLEQPEGAGFLGAELDALDQLTAERAHEIGRKYFNTDKATIIKVVPDGKEGPKGERADFTYKPEDEESLSIPTDIDPAEAKRPLPLQDIAPPDGQTLEFELDNGMKVVLVQSSQIPVMDVQLIIGGGTADAGAGGVPAIMAQRAYGPLTDRDAQSYQNYFDLAGGLFDGRVGAYSTSFSTRGLSIYLDFLIAGLADQVINAEYQTSALEGWKQGQRELMKKQSYRQMLERQNTFNTALYGAGHPHERHALTNPDELKQVNLRDIEKFRETYYRGANSAIIVTGGFDMNLVTQYVTRFFGEPKIRARESTWSGEKVSASRPPVPEPKPGDIRFITQVDAERVMTDITIAYPLAEVFGDDHAALMVLADMLNFQASSVRQTLGASYGIYARVDASRPQVAVGGAVDGARSNEGYRAIKGAIDNLHDNADFDRLFAFSRRNVLRELVNDQADPQMLAGRLGQSIQYGLSYDYYTDLARRVATLRPEQVKAQIERVLRDEKSITMFIGPKTGIDDIIVGSQIVGAKSLPEVVHDEDD